MSLLRQVYSWVFDGIGNPIGSLNGALNVHLAGVHNSLINDAFHRHTGVSTTLSSPTAVGAISIVVASATGFAIGDYIQIGGHATADFTYTKIINIVGTTISLNRPLGNVRAAGSEVSQIIVNVASVSGSMASPQSYKVVPSSTQVWHVERFLLEMVHSSAGDLSLFGNLTALSNGVVVRKYDGLTGTYSTYTVWQNNEDIYLDTADISFPVRSGGGGSYATVSAGLFSDIGVTIKLDGAAGDYLEVLVQDNLTALTSFRIKAQGHLEGA